MTIFALIGREVTGEANFWGSICLGGATFLNIFFFYFFLFCGLLLKITSAGKRFLAKVALDVQLMFFFFFFLKKKCFVREISRFLCFCKIHRFENLWWHHRHCYIMEVTLFWILNTINEFCNISNIFLAQCWDFKLVPSPVMILLKWQYSKIWPFLIIPYSPFQKN